MFKVFVPVIMFTLTAVLLCSCGSLSAPVGGEQLSAKTMDYARAMPSGGSKMWITSKGVEMSTPQWQSKVVPALLVYYWKVLGYYPKTEQYGVRKFATFFPLFFVTRNQVYDKDGDREQSTIETLIALVLWYKDRTTPNSSDFRCGLLWIPGLGPMIGVGPEYFQFFWIPFSDF